MPQALTVGAYHVGVTFRKAVSVKDTPYRYLPLLSPVYRALRQFVRQYVYAGTRVACPICERKFRGWLNDKQNGSCPGCGSEARHRFLWLYLASEWLGKEEALELLHFAPELCLQPRFDRDPRLSRYVTADQSAPNVDFHTDITKLLFEEKSFDAIVCSHVLEHIPDDRAAMHEMRRVLRPGRVAYIQVPLARELLHTDEDTSVIDPKDRESRFGQFDHVRRYGMDLGERLREAGFEVGEVRPRDILDEKQLVSYGLWDDTIFRCEAKRCTSLESFPGIVNSNDKCL